MLRDVRSATLFVLPSIRFQSQYMRVGHAAPTCADNVIQAIVSELESLGAEAVIHRPFGLRRSSITNGPRPKLAYDFIATASSTDEL